MRVKYGNTWIAPGSVEGASGSNWDFTQANDQANYFRANESAWFARGARACTFSFRVWRFFATQRAAIEFASTHLAELAQQADLELYADGDEEPCSVLFDAVLSNFRPPRIIGCAVACQYSFSGGLFTIPS